MSDNANPYQSPQADIKPVGSLASQGGLTENMITYLREASPWLRFIGILTFIGCGIVVLVGVAALVVPAFQIWDGISGVISGVIYVGCAALVFFPARFIYNFGAKIRSFLQSNSGQDLEQAFKNNKSLWKFYGILAIVYVALIPVIIVIGVIAAVTSSMFQ